MNPRTQTQTAEPKPQTFRQTSHQGCPTTHEESRRKQEADKLFEARLQWFLALSAAA